MLFILEFSRNCLVLLNDYKRNFLGLILSFDCLSNFSGFTRGSAFRLYSCFEKRLSFKAVNAYATMLNGFMGNRIVYHCLIEVLVALRNATKGDSMKTYVHRFSFHLAKTQ